ncbi:MAG: hypothetical protein HeimC2_05130 [Candidatus Heimdallarchaeota archaeon LC_2]|nr:MAG: hypothetical protein HeimC2_05130 [Candidatus Heimdallarchaeota archaeon LC_2]
MIVDENHVYLTTRKGELWGKYNKDPYNYLSIFNKDIQNFTLINEFRVSGEPIETIIKIHNYLYVGSRYNLSIIDVSDINNIQLVDNLEVDINDETQPVLTCGIKSDLSVLYIIRHERATPTGPSTLHTYLSAIDISDKSSISILSSFEIFELPFNCRLYDNKIITGGIILSKIYNVSDIENIQETAQFPELKWVYGLEIKGSYAFIAHNPNITIIDLKTDRNVTKYAGDGNWRFNNLILQNLGTTTEPLVYPIVAGGSKLHIFNTTNFEFECEVPTVFIDHTITDTITETTTETQTTIDYATITESTITTQTIVEYETTTKNIPITTTQTDVLTTTKEGTKTITASDNNSAASTTSDSIFEFNPVMFIGILVLIINVNSYKKKR